ncbi:MAG: class I SAM-dependent methyltransferase [Owenweeksia sp.]
MATKTFSGNRFSTFTDTDTQEWKGLFDELKKFSDDYLKALRKHNLWPANYYWPQDSLMTNTRVWEYPYVLDILNKYAQGGKLLDIGSALTFLPYFLSHKGYEVFSLDYDQQMVDWSADIRKKLDQVDPGFSYKPLSSYAQGDVTDLQFQDESFDIVTNVSVLEHLPFDMIMKSADSVYRVLKKGGIFICTLDCLVSGDGNAEHMPLNDVQFKEFLNILTNKFELVEENVSSSPDALMTNKKKLFDRNKEESPKTLRQRVGVARRMVWDKNYNTADNSLEWTAYGFTLRKV